MMTRLLDILISFAGLILLSPVFLVIAMIIPLDSKGPAIYRQTRVGKGGRDFRLIKFRTMTTGADQKGGITVGVRDARITRAGHLLRKYKLDELPQLLNVLRGEMSLVGPRPEIRKYVEMYTPEQRRVLEVRPGITDWASIEYINENEILGNAADWEQCYTEEVMPAKIRLNMRYIENPSMRHYLILIGKTIRHIFS